VAQRSTSAARNSTFATPTGARWQHEVQKEGRPFSEIRSPRAQPIEINQQGPLPGERYARLPFNVPEDGREPRMPDGFKTEVDKKGWRH
jgi:hypothetical protein